MHHLVLVRLVGRLSVRLRGRHICSHLSTLLKGLIGKVARPGEAVPAVQGGETYTRSPRSWKAQGLKICLLLLFKQLPAMRRSRLLLLSVLGVDLGTRIV